MYSLVTGELNCKRLTSLKSGHVLRTSTCLSLHKMLVLGEITQLLKWHQGWRASQWTVILSIIRVMLEILGMS